MKKLHKQLFFYEEQVETIRNKKTQCVRAIRVS